MILEEGLSMRGMKVPCICAVAILIASHATAQNTGFPGTTEVIELAQFELIKTGFYDGWEEVAVHTGFRAAGHLGPTRAIYPVEDGFALVEGGGLRYFRVAPDGEISFQETFSSFPWLDNGGGSAFVLPTPRRAIMEADALAKTGRLPSGSISGHVVDVRPYLTEFEYDPDFKNFGVYRFENLYNIYTRGWRIRDGIRIPLSEGGYVWGDKQAFKWNGKNFIAISLYGGVGIVDCDASPIRLVSWINIGSNVSGLKFNNGYLYAELMVLGYPEIGKPPAWQEMMLAIIDVRNPSAITLKSISSLGATRSVGSRGVVPDGQMYVFDDRIYFFNSYPFDGSEDLQHYDDHVFVRVLDISDPANPTIMVDQFELELRHVFSSDTVFTELEPGRILSYLRETQQPLQDANFLILDSSNPAELPLINESPIRLYTLWPRLGPSRIGHYARFAHRNGNPNL